MLWCNIGDEKHFSEKILIFFHLFCLQAGYPGIESPGTRVAKYPESHRPTEKY